MLFHNMKCILEIRIQTKNFHKMELLLLFCTFLLTTSLLTIEFHASPKNVKIHMPFSYILVGFSDLVIEAMRECQSI